MTNDEFGEYLAGLIEADGCFDRGCCEIVFQYTDFALAVAICKRLGLDPEKHVRDARKNKRNCYRFLVARGSCGSILKATNGKFVAPYKVAQIKKFGYDTYLNISVKNASLSNYTGFWLTGFIEGDGTICINSNRSCHLGIGQSSLEILELVASKFRLNVCTRAPCKRSSKRKLQSTVATSGKEKLRLFFDHFDKFPLQGTKGVKMLFFYEAYKVRIKKKHLTAQGRILFEIYQDHIHRVKPLNNKTGLCVVGLTNENDIKFEDENNDEKLPDGRPAKRKSKKKSKKSQKGRPAKRSSKTTQKKVDTN